ncbi:MAG: tetratricopeptide repeat protein [Pleurocapsa sp. SU_196_0]|nr:tetratricopeptide repeat protein [Pleurocapsa sp. SU_196_0]
MLRFQAPPTVCAYHQPDLRVSHAVHLPQHLERRAVRAVDRANREHPSVRGDGDERRQAEVARGLHTPHSTRCAPKTGCGVTGTPRLESKCRTMNFEMPLESSERTERWYGTVLEAWDGREQNRERSKRLAHAVRLEAGGDAWLTHCANVVTAYATMREGWMADALGLVLPALTWFEEMGDERWLARALNVHNCVTAELGEFERCIVGLGRQFDISRGAGDVEMEICALHDLGAMHLERDPVRAEEHLRSALELAVQSGLPHAQGYALLNLTQLHVAQGRPDEARALLAHTRQLLGARPGLRGNARTDAARMSGTRGGRTAGS